MRGGMRGIRDRESWRWESAPGRCDSFWWAHQDSNLEPTDYESAALTVELWARALRQLILTSLVGCTCGIHRQRSRCPTLVHFIEILPVFCPNLLSGFNLSGSICKIRF